METKSTYELPAGYTLVEKLDLMNGKDQLKMNLYALGIMLLTMVVLLALLPKPMIQSFPLIPFLVLFVIYIILHELTHGAAIKLLTGAPVKYGFNWTSASAGNPDIYFFQRDYVVIALMPFVVWTMVGLLLFPFFPPNFFLGFIVLFAVHISGCVGDYICAWKAFRYKGCYVKDSGTKMEFYIKQERIP